MANYILAKKISTKKLPSKALRMISEADDLVIAEKQEEVEKDSENYISELLEAACSVSVQEIALKCLSLGYNAEAFCGMSHEDVVPEFWNELMEELKK